MGLFAGNKTIRLYVKEDGLTKEQTDSWFEILEELPAHLDMELRKIFADAKVIMKSDGSYEMELSDLQGQIPFKFLTKVIKNWSEEVPITVENLQKVKSTILWDLWNYMQRLYGIVQGEPDELLKSAYEMVMTG